MHALERPLRARLPKVAKTATTHRTVAARLTPNPRHSDGRTSRCRDTTLVPEGASTLSNPVAGSAPQEVATPSAVAAQPGKYNCGSTTAPLQPSNSTCIPLTSGMIVTRAPELQPDLLSAARRLGKWPFPRDPTQPVRAAATGMYSGGYDQSVEPVIGL
jgi:hypothetical protein